MLKAGVAITGAALLFACGDDSSSGADGSQTATGVDSTVESIDDLLNCTPKHEGETAYIKEEKATYVCVDGDWITGSISESIDDLLNCTPKHEGETVFVKEDKKIYVCTDGDWVVAGETGDEGDDDGDNADKKSSSSKAKSADSKGKSSSSEGGGGASSSSVIASSSSEELVSSSSFNKSSSSSLTSCSSKGAKNAWDYLNPSIDYGEITDSRDCQVYKTVKIGDQVWMAENLNYAYTGVKYNYSGYTSDSISWCYSNDASNCEIYGRLYTWAAAMDGAGLVDPAGAGVGCGYGKICGVSGSVRGICPEGWHLPSYDEWETLFTAVGGSSKAGTALKSQTGWKSQTGDAADRDAYGFSALPAGRRNGGGNFINAGDYANFWSASQYEGNSYSAYYVFLYYYDEKARRDYLNKGHGFSVRCLQN